MKAGPSKALSITVGGNEVAVTHLGVQVRLPRELPRAAVVEKAQSMAREALEEREWCFAVTVSEPKFHDEWVDEDGGAHPAYHEIVATGYRIDEVAQRAEQRVGLLLENLHQAVRSIAS